MHTAELIRENNEVKDLGSVRPTLLAQQQIHNIGLMF